tara:strand:- start:660 stop:1109 length:450 start_codon:yes stop_codon:yes gene_type:complete
MEFNTMKQTQKIGWQKYEDVIESQISSPLLDRIYQSMSEMINEYQIKDSNENGIDMETQMQSGELDQQPLMLNLDESISTEIALANNFDCWVAHTNFNLTESIKNELDKVEGIEILKIFSRYRFLIGVGKMFAFKDVRKTVETKLGTLD